MFSRKGARAFPKHPSARVIGDSFRLNQVRVCRTAWARTKGLLGTAHLDSDEGCLLYPCGSVHTFGMAFAIDVIFLSQDRKVVKITRALAPWRVTLGPSGSFAVIEVRAGVARGVEVGDTLRFVEIG